MAQPGDIPASEPSGHAADDVDDATYLEALIAAGPPDPEEDGGGDAHQ